MLIPLVATLSGLVGAASVNGAAWRRSQRHARGLPVTGSLQALPELQRFRAAIDACTDAIYLLGALQRELPAPPLLAPAPLEGGRVLLLDGDLPAAGCGRGSWRCAVCSRYAPRARQRR